MPSKHTVVVSLDLETERIVNELGGNRSQWIRDAIKWRHTSDVEVLQALADARGRRIEHMLRHVRKVAYMSSTGTIEAHGKMAENALRDLAECDY